tara:strand:- start:22022 stop:23149 length:1128 start_codon:yes stop_codon:yes gene_type:complete
VRPLVRTVASCALAPLALTGLASAQICTGITFLGDVYEVDLSTSATTFIGSTGMAAGNQIATDGDGTIYAILDDDQLVTIDPTTAATTWIATLAVDEVRALAIDPTSGLLYAAIDASVVAGAFDEIWTIDLAGPTVNVLGSTGLAGLQALDFAPNGTLYGWDLGPFPPNGDGLVVINLNTGAALPINPANNNGWVHQWLVVVDETTAYVGASSYEQVHLTTGNTTPVGTFGVALQGLDLRFQPIGLPLCSGQPNSTGVDAEILISGSTTIAANHLRLDVSDLPPNQFGIFVMGQFPGNIPVGQGILCLGLPFVRFPNNILDSGLSGTVFLEPDLTSLPSMTTFLPGDTWGFQYWTRDLNPGMTSNLSGAARVTFQ